MCSMLSQVVRDEAKRSAVESRDQLKVETLVNGVPHIILVSAIHRLYRKRILPWLPNNSN